MDRTMFERSRAAEYFDAEELQIMTGQPDSNFASVALKELVDNALDACEKAGVVPEVGIEVAEKDGIIRLSISDNGEGIPPGGVRKILNYETRTSDKAAYRSPTRGALGNALKTVIGMPCALGLENPVVIEARGVRHEIRAWIDPAGELRIDHDETEADGKGGTLVTLELPADDQDFSPEEWAAAFAAFNPHAFVKMSDFALPPDLCNEHGESPLENSRIYKPTAGDGFKKFTSTDSISAHWYDVPALKTLVFSHIANARGGGRDLPLGEFVRQFRSLSASRKRKAVCDGFPEIKRLSDFEDREERVADLLDAMQEAADPPTHKVLGTVGKAHFREFFESRYGHGPPKRLWYKTAKGEEDGVPYIFEIAVAETEDPGGFHHCINFSPSFTDPLGSTWLSAGEVEATGMGNFVSQAYASPSSSRRWGGPNVAVAAHLISPNLTFLELGKSRLEVGEEMANQIAEATWNAVKTLYGEEEKRRRDAARQEKRRDEREAKEIREAERQARWEEERFKPPRELFLTEAVPMVMEEAWRKATGDGALEASARSLFYQARPLAQKLTSRELKDTYFTQTLLPAYQHDVRALPGVYYEGRGTLHEPHGGRAVPLGTREQQSYVFPKYLYNKILFIEKKGLYPALQSARLGERHDMAIVAGEGFASEAARKLFENAEAGEYELYVAHDSDDSGYNIARTLREETARMPGYSVNVVDLGLWLDDALEMGLDTETYTRKAKLTQGLELNEIEREYFEGRRVGERSWICRRVELNALSSPQLVEYIEFKLEENGASGKVIPPDEALEHQAKAAHVNLVKEEVEHKAEELFPIQRIMLRVNAEIEEEFADTTIPDGSSLRSGVESDFRRDPALAWGSSVTTSVHEAARDCLQERESRITELLAEKIDELREER